MKLNEKVHSSTHRVCLYGPPKTGKTELAGLLAEYYNLIWLDLENGYITLTKMPEEWQRRVNLISIPDTKTYPIAIETMLKVITGAEVSICDAHGKVGCAECKKSGASFTTVALKHCTEEDIVVIDSLTQLSNSAMSNITRTKPDDYKPDWEDYRNQGALLDKFLSQVQQAKYNIICITHEAEVELEDKRKKLVPVAGTANFSRNTAKYFDHVIYAEIKNNKHTFNSSTTSSNSLVAGSRTGVSIEKEATPTLFSIFKPRGKQEIPASERAGKENAGEIHKAGTPGEAAAEKLKALAGKL